MAKHRDFFKQFFDEKIMIIRKKSSIAKEKIQLAVVKRNIASIVSNRDWRYNKFTPVMMKIWRFLWN